MKLLKIFRRRGARPEQLILRLEIDRETDGRWIVEAVDLPGVMCYGTTREEARNSAALLALRVIDERLQHGEALPDFEPDPEDAPHVHHHA
jgi:predicted RNase H-like HicB family nuclease